MVFNDTRLMLFIGSLLLISSVVMLGSRKRLLGGFIGIMVTVGLFDVLIESVVPIPSQYAGLLYNAKYFLYGLILMLVLMFRPSGILGDKRRDTVVAVAGKSNNREG